MINKPHLARAIFNIRPGFNFDSGFEKEKENRKYQTFKSTSRSLASKLDSMIPWLNTP
jgi:hypothetical protein